MGAARNTSPQEIDTVAKAIANYQIAPLTGWVLRGDWGKAVMARVMQLNPNYQASQFAARTSAARAFSSGPLGNFIRSFSVAESHLDLASQLAEALQNGKSQTLNRLRNTLRTEFGSAAVPNFETAKQIVADEVAKAVIGGQMGEGDRQNLQRQLDAASSPEQLAGAIQTFRSLMAGQLEGFKRQYMTSTGGTEQDFDRMLSPEARREMAPRGQTGGQAASAQPAASAALPKGQYPIPSSKAVATLKAHPEMAPQFDQAFGPGAAKRALGQ
jgi:hypothetical protein